MKATMKIISLWISVPLWSFGLLALISYLENGYQESAASGCFTSQVEDALEKRFLHRNLHLLSADAERMMEANAK